MINSFFFVLSFLLYFYLFIFKNTQSSSGERSFAGCPKRKTRKGVKEEEASFEDPHGPSFFFFIFFFLFLFVPVKKIPVRRWNCLH